MRLIDADAIMKRLEYAYDGTPTVEYYDNGDPVTFEMKEIKNLIRNAPTVSPWVKTSDRLPEGKDAFEDKVLVYNFVERRQQLKLWLIVRTYPHVFPLWMPIPPLPEEENE